MIIKNWQTYWKSHSTRFDAHVYGTCMVDHQSKHFIPLVPKNASTWVKDFVGFVPGNYHDELLVQNNYTPVIFLREPVNRWSSGIAEFLHRYGIAGSGWRDNLNSIALDLLFKRVAFDEHTESQSMYLEGIDTEKAVFFKVDQTLNANVNHYFNQTVTPTTNTYVTSGKKHSIKKYFTDLINTNPEYKQRITEYYQVDTDLINSVQYYNNQRNS